MKINNNTNIKFEQNYYARLKGQAKKSGKVLLGNTVARDLLELSMTKAAGSKGILFTHVNRNDIDVFFLDEPTTDNFLATKTTSFWGEMFKALKESPETKKLEINLEEIRLQHLQHAIFKNFFPSKTVN